MGEIRTVFLPDTNYRFTALSCGDDVISVRGNESCCS